MKKKYPKNISEYLLDKISNLPKAAALALLFDPQQILNIQNYFIDEKGKKWKVFCYNLNDLQFRKVYNNIKNSAIIVITSANLNYIGDILTSADEIFDCSLKGILKTLIPQEDNWPDVICEFKYEILENLSEFVEVYKKLKKNLLSNQLLNKSHIKILVLCLRYENIDTFLLNKEHKDIQDVIFNYISAIFLYSLNDDDIEILKRIVNDINIPDKEVLYPYLKVSKRELAEYLYFKNITKRYNLKDDEVILRGLGILNIDIDEFVEGSLEPNKIFSGSEGGFEPEGSSTVNYLLRNISDECWNKIVHFNEESLSPNSIDKLLNKFNFRKTNNIPKGILNERFPLVVMRLIYRFFSFILDNKSAHYMWNEIASSSIRTSRNDILEKTSDFAWIKNIRSENLYTSKYTERTASLLFALQKLEFVLSTLDIKFEKKNTLDKLLRFYQDNKIYLLELYSAALYRAFKTIDSEEIRENLLDAIQKLKEKTQNYLEDINQNLCNLIEKNTKQFNSFHLLSTNLIKDMKEDFQPNEKQKLWILIFDGMRLDTYEEIVKPELCKYFDIARENLYLCPLPSITDIARISLLSQKLPSNWQDYSNNYTSDHNILAARGFYLTKAEGKKKLRIVVASETDYGQQKLDLHDAPYNILIYNLSDDWIHNYRNDLYELNSTIKESFEKNILPDLIGRIKDNDFVILASDHGFIEMSKENTFEIVCNEGNQSNVSFRYLRDVKNEYGMNIDYGSKNIYSVAKGRKSFLREKGKMFRYSHGGASMQEMVIPCVLLKKITKPIINLELILPGTEIEVVTEDTEERVKFVVRNTGNQITEFELKITYEKEKIEKDKLLPAKEFEYEFSFVPSLKTNFITTELRYKKLDNEIFRDTKRISFKVEERKDKVEIGTSALDRFDDT